MRARSAVAAALLVGGLASVAAWRTAHPRLEEPLARSLERALHLPDGAVAIERAELRAPAKLVIERLRAGGLAIDRIAIAVDPFAALGGHARPEKMIVSGARLGDRFGAARLEVTAGATHGGFRVVGRDVTFPAGGTPVAVRELGLELEVGQLTRVAFAGLSLGGATPLLDELAGAATRDPDAPGVGYRLRAARPGLTVTGEYAAGVIEARATLSRLPIGSLATIARRVGLATAGAHASGTIEARSAAGEGVAAHGTLALDDVALDHPALAGRPIGPLSLALEGSVAAHAGELTVDTLHVGLGPAQFVLAGRATRDGELEGRFALEKIPCGALLRALPRDLVPALDELTLDGEVAARAHTRGSLDDLPALTLEVAVDNACKVLGDPPLADARALTFRYGIAPPWFRPLSSLPESLIRVFLASEDGRFFQHHGFDLDMIRRALAADVSLGRFDRGASTISQQLVKNLYLTGQRNAARKLEELALTWRLEQVVDKRRILELYLNLVELGPGIWGVAEGAERYFGKEPEELTVDEMAQLAALLPAPRRGMDAAWQKRYASLKSRLPNEKVVIPDAGSAPIRLTRR